MRNAKRKNPVRAADKLSRLEVRQLQVLVALAESGGISAAARSLGLAQSTVSETLAALERGLGAALLRRQHGRARATLTAAGIALLPHARKVLAAIDVAHLAVAQAARGGRSHLHILTVESVSSYILPGVLRKMRARWPNLRLGVSIAPGVGLEDALGAGEFDLGLALARDDECEPGRPAAPRHRVVRTRLPVVMFSSPSHPQARGAVRRPDLADCPLYVSDAAFGFDTFVKRYVRGARPNRPQAVAAGSVEAVKRAVAGDSSALGILPAYALADELEAGILVSLDLRPPPPRVRLEAVLSPNCARHPAVDELLHAVSQAFGSTT